jgi:hypothetical protein
MARLTGVFNVTGPVAPLDDTDTYSVLDPIYMQDGYRSVNTAADRNAIPEARRRFGMLVAVTGSSDTGVYQLKNVALGGVDNVITNNNNWVLFTTGTTLATGSLITTGSISSTQSITGSLVISGSHTVTGSSNISSRLNVAGPAVANMSASFWNRMQITSGSLEIAGGTRANVLNISTAINQGLALNITNTNTGSSAASQIVLYNNTNEYAQFYMPSTTNTAAGSAGASRFMLRTNGSRGMLIHSESGSIDIGVDGDRTIMSVTTSSIFANEVTSSTIVVSGTSVRISGSTTITGSLSVLSGFTNQGPTTLQDSTTITVGGSTKLTVAQNAITLGDIVGSSDAIYTNEEVKASSYILEISKSYQDTPQGTLVLNVDGEYVDIQGEGVSAKVRRKEIVGFITASAGAGFIEFYRTTTDAIGVTTAMLDPILDPLTSLQVVNAVSRGGSGWSTVTNLSTADNIVQNIATTWNTASAVAELAPISQLGINSTNLANISHSLSASFTGSLGGSPNNDPGAGSPWIAIAGGLSTWVDYTPSQSYAQYDYVQSGSQYFAAKTTANNISFPLVTDSTWEEINPFPPEPWAQGGGAPPINGFRTYDGSYYILTSDTEFDPQVPPPDAPENWALLTDAGMFTNWPGVTTYSNRYILQSGSIYYTNTTDPVTNNNGNVNYPPGENTSQWLALNGAPAAWDTYTAYAAYSSSIYSGNYYYNDSSISAGVRARPPYYIVFYYRNDSANTQEFRYNLTII